MHIGFVGHIHDLPFFLVGKIMYSSLPKTYWRNYVWNALHRRVGHRPSSTIIYLVGPEDLDRATAMAKGFRNENLIAVDLNQDYVYNVRKNGGLAVQGNICSVLAHWPSNWPLNGIVLDFKGGLNNSVNEVLISLFTCQAIQYGRTQVCINLQRGRDPESNPIRQGIDKIISKYEARKGLLPDGAWDILIDKLHRGKHFFVHLLSNMWRSLDDGHPAKVVGYLQLALAQCRPQFYSYRQTPTQPYMDSVIFTFPHAKVEDRASCYKIWKEMFPKDNMRAKLAALRALRTIKVKHA